MLKNKKYCKNTERGAFTVYYKFFDLSIPKSQYFDIFFKNNTIYCGWCIKRREAARLGYRL